MKVETMTIKILETGKHFVDVEVGNVIADEGNLRFFEILEISALLQSEAPGWDSYILAEAEEIPAGSDILGDYNTVTDEVDYNDFVIFGYSIRYP